MITIVALNHSCQNDDETVKPDSGKKYFSTQIDGLKRECYVHVPLSYDAKVKIPVVLMVHGSGGNGEKFYNISGWKEVGEAHNILTVFPSSPQYPCVLDDSVEKSNAKKWSSYDLELCGGGTPVDDIKFLSLVIEQLKKKYNVDEKRIYMVGFSNGGEMASRAAVELSDQLAAVVACAGALLADTTFQPVRNLPILLQIGNSDEKLLARLGNTNPLPMDINQLFINFSTVQEVTNTFISTFGLNSNFTTGGDPNQFLYADYDSDPANNDNSFRFMLVKGLGHNYPNGKNHPMKGAEVHWKWMKNHRLP